MFRKINILVYILLVQTIAIILFASGAFAATPSSYEIVEVGSTNVPGVNYKIVETHGTDAPIDFTVFAGTTAGGGGYYFRTGTSASGCRVIYNLVGGDGVLVTGTCGSSLQKLDDHAEANPSLVTAVAIGGDSTAYEDLNQGALANNADSELPPTCTSSTSGAFDWIMCGGVNILVGAVNAFANFISNFLKISPVVSETNDGPSSIYLAWNGVKNFSLSLMVVAALVAVFGQTIGIEAYTVKKMLPRIIIASIGILLSFGIVAILVDIFNVLGAGIHDLLIGTLGSTIEVDFASFITATLGTLTGIGVGVGVGILWAAPAGVAAAAGTVALFILLPLFLSILSVFLTLIFRQILIVVLIIVSPLALLAWTLPNTEKYFKLWFDTLVKALVMYPLIMILLTSGQIYAAIITSGTAEGSRGPANLLIALLAISLPLFLVPMTFKFAGSAISSTNAALKGLGKKTEQAIKGDAGDPFSNRNKLQSARNAHRDDWARKTRTVSDGAGGTKKVAGRLQGFSNKKGVRWIPGIGSVGAKQSLEGAQTRNNAKQIIDSMKNGPDGRSVKTMLLGGDVAIDKIDHRTGRVIPGTAGTDEEVARGEQAATIPGVWEAAYAEEVGVDVGSRHDMEQYVDALANAPSGVDLNPIFNGATKGHGNEVGRLGFNRQTLSVDSSTGAATSHFGWERGQGTDAERLAQALDFDKDMQKVNSHALSNHREFSFESMSNFVEYADEFGMEDTMQTMVDSAADVADGMSYVDPKTGTMSRGRTNATPEAQRGARDFLARAVAAGYDYKPPATPPATTTGGTSPTGPAGGASPPAPGKRVKGPRPTPPPAPPAPSPPTGPPPAGTPRTSPPPPAPGSRRKGYIPTTPPTPTPGPPSPPTGPPPNNKGS